ncbi:hypothetical protein BDR07DRAFT_1394274 [Suillus spraguei]|nr:hypothetical protein BDR07DRAFT_1394274 [Suillus spraguei]
MVVFRVEQLLHLITMSLFEHMHLAYYNVTPPSTPSTTKFCAFQKLVTNSVTEEHFASSAPSMIQLYFELRAHPVKLVLAHSPIPSQVHLHRNPSHKYHGR